MTAEPFLRWAGGKRWLARRIAPLVAARLAGTYREPFLGAGSMFFGVQPARAALSDVNPDLIEAWTCVVEQPDAVLDLVREKPVDKATYLDTRRNVPRTSIERAARFIYLKSYLLRRALPHQSTRVL